MLAVGAKVPKAGACDDEGNRVMLSSFAGKPFVIWFYPRADTPG